MSMVKFVAFDVDGTLRDRSYMPDSTREAVRRLRQAGVELALCTGRSEYEIAGLREELGIDWAITCNGAHVAYQGSTVFGTAFDDARVQRWLETSRSARHSLLLYGSQGMYWSGEDDSYFRRAQQEIGFLEPLPLHEEPQLPAVYQAIVFCTEAEERAYTAVSGGASGTDATDATDAKGGSLYTHRWRPWAVDLNPQGVHKAAGLALLLEHLGVRREETAAFGDGLNDLELLSSVGIGIAMGNGCDELKAVATHVTKPLAEDGIAYAVERWLLR
ncbi:Cof-type HAD-IIB family hydrolase [Paenibacillus sp. YYML68]|uniref:Cof-type HAD-IIB family hydrolase n=1 Tax=Paenibacillus sp. YYML68 TaxID=2909250 RepID=UPI002493A32A|nr:Cof-type HAD-IIB family hydrolase [Paenibacillus sp. YYML68]